MKTHSKNAFWRKLMSMLLAVAMVIGFLPAIQVEAAGLDGHSNDTFVVANNFDLDYGNGSLVYHDEDNWDGAEYEEPMWHSSSNDKVLDFNIGTRMCQFAVVDSTADGGVKFISQDEMYENLSVAYAEEYTEDDDTSYRDVSEWGDYLCFDTERYTYWDEEKQEDVEETFENVFAFRIYRAGAYKLTYNESDLYINAWLPEVGLYSESEASDGAYIDGWQDYSSEDSQVTIYAISQNEDLKINSVRNETEYGEAFNYSKINNYTYSISFSPLYVEDDFGTEFIVELENIYDEEDLREECLNLTLYKDREGLIFVEPDWDNRECFPEELEEWRINKSVREMEVGGCTTWYIGTLNEGEFTPITDTSVLNIDSGLELEKRTDGDSGKYDIFARKTGTHFISYNGSKVSVVNVQMPFVGLYSKPEISEENVLEPYIEHTKTDGSEKIYIIVRDVEDRRISSDSTPRLIINESENELSNSSLIGFKEYTTSVSGAQKVYELSLKSKMRCGVHVMLEIDGEEELYDFSFEKVYDGEDRIDDIDYDVIRVSGEDGTDWVGYSGAFISKESYETGLTWFKGRFPDGIAYYVHARTIQGVVDKLLDVAENGATIWDDEKQEDVPITIPNTGYIELNMSYRDASYIPAVQEEQYVYAPASIKGILMNAAENPYMIPHKDLSGNVLYWDEYDSGDSNRPYYDVMQLELTDEAQAKKVGQAMNISGTKSGSNDAIIHGVCLDFNDEYLAEREFGETKLAALKDLETKQGVNSNEDIPFDESERYGGEAWNNQKWLLQKATYNSLTGNWDLVDGQYYVVANGDVKLELDACDQEIIERRRVCQWSFMQLPHRWPTLHVNASTHVRIQGLWTEDNPELYIGFYDGEDELYTDAYDQRFTRDDIGTTTTVRFERPQMVYNPSANKSFEHQLYSDVKVHVVRAESKTNIDDTYSEGGKKAEIVVDEEAISDFVPMTEEEKQAIIDGGSLDVDMSVDKISGAVNADEAAAITDISKEIKKEISNSSVDYINVDLDYKIKANNGNGYGQSKKITETNEPVTISIPVSSSMKDKKNYYVYRYHDGGVEKIPATYDAATGTLTFETDKFSVYAIATEGGSNNTSGGGSSGGGGGAAGGGGSTTDKNDDKKDTDTTDKKDDTTDTKTETKEDGTVVTTETKTETDGSKVELIKEVSADGKTTSSVEVKTDATGKVTESVVTVETEATGKKLTVDAATITEMIAKNDSATVANTTVVLTANDAKGNEKFTVEVDAKDLKADAKLTVYALDKNGNPVLVDTTKNTVKVDKDGNIQIKITGKGDFTVANAADAKKIDKAIAKTVKPAKTQATVKEGKKTTFKLDKGCNEDNIQNITYKSNNANVKVGKNGKITAKAAGKATIKATVTLKNGKTKTIKMKVNVK